MTNTLEFRVDHLADLDTNLASIKTTPRLDADIRPPRSAALRQLARFFKVRREALDLAEHLYGGHQGLVIVLLEPTTIHSRLSPRETYLKSNTLQVVDRALRFATKGHRNWENTSIIDVRPFRSADKRQSESQDQRRANDEIAYQCFLQLIAELRPTVLLMAQCGTADSANPVIRALNSSIKACCVAQRQQIGNRACTVVQSFHPSVFARRHLEKWREDHGATDSQTRTRELALRGLFRLSFLVANHAIEGRKITGLGRETLHRILNEAKSVSGRGS